MTIHRDRIASNYDRLSRFYGLLAEPSEAWAREAGLQMLAVRPGEAVLEVGFGAGGGLLRLAEACGPSGRVCGLDLSAGMCAAAQARVRARGLTGRVSLVRGDAADLPLAAEAFDAVFMSFSLELFDDAGIHTVLLGCRRALRPDGRLGVAAMSSCARPGLMLRLYEQARRMFPDFVDCRPIDVQGALAAAGFQVAQSAERSLWGLPVTLALAHRPAP